ncbi:MAG: TonB-dependent receptor [Comamonadaceae bacterium]|nr:MAG: TonB-dependent receptor [Comamonadaceae bacterium]
MESYCTVAISRIPLKLFEVAKTLPLVRRREKMPFDFNDVDRRFTSLTLAAQHQLDDAWRLDGGLTYNHLRHDTNGTSVLQLLVSQRERLSPAERRDTEKVLAPRLGAVWQPHAGLTVRAAYQDWMRPLSVSTLNSVETAGIPVEDRLVESGGRMKRSVVQVGMALGERTFVSGRLDHTRVNNPTSPGADLRTPSLPFLEELRNAQLVNLSATDVLEDTPSFERGTLRAAAFGVNHMFSRQFSGYAKYLYQDSSSSFEGTATATQPVSGLQIPYLPRNTLVLGATWASPQRLYLSGRVVYRSERFEDKENLTARPAGWNLDLVGFWESADKHWVIGAGALNLLGRKSERQSRRLVIDARYRF